jgi:Tfp pilus assembly protein PilV
LVAGWSCGSENRQGWRHIWRGGHVTCLDISLLLGMGTQPRWQDRRCDGFTIIESAIAGLIMLFVLASVLAVAAQGFRYLNDLRRWARSSQVLQQKMEDIRLITVFTNIWAQDGTVFTNRDIVGVPFTGHCKISSYDPPYPTTVSAQVTLTVTWLNSGGRQITNRLSSLVTANGLNKYIF